MCAAVIGSTPATSIVQHTSPVPGLTVRVAVPLPSRSPWFGSPASLTSASPVSSTLNGTPTSSADAGKTLTSSSPTDARRQMAERRTDDIATPEVRKCSGVTSEPGSPRFGRTEAQFRGCQRLGSFPSRLPYRARGAVPPGYRGGSQEPGGNRGAVRSSAQPYHCVAGDPDGHRGGVVGLHALEEAVAQISRDTNSVDPIPEPVDLDPLVGEPRSVGVSPTNRQPHPDLGRRGGAAAGVARAERGIPQSEVDLGVVVEAEAGLGPAPEDAAVRTISVNAVNGELLEPVDVPVIVAVSGVEGIAVGGRDADAPISAVASVDPLLEAHPGVAGARPGGSYVEPAWPQVCHDCGEPQPLLRGRVLDVETAGLVHFQVRPPLDDSGSAGAGVGHRQDADEQDQQQRAQHAVAALVCHGSTPP